MRNFTILLATTFVFFTFSSNAQVSVSLNYDSNPERCGNYHNDAEYLYYPELECYYDLIDRVYIYYGPYGWERSCSLPIYCSNFNIRRAYSVAINYHGSSPFFHFQYHKMKYRLNHHRNYRQEYYGSRYTTPNRRVFTSRYEPRRNYNYHRSSDRNDIFERTDPGARNLEETRPEEGNGRSEATRSNEENRRREEPRRREGTSRTNEAGGDTAENPRNSNSRR